MKLPEKIERLIESRQTEAIQKNLSQKLRLIASVLGFAIRDKATGGGLEAGLDVMGYANHRLLDPWWDSIEDEVAMPTDPNLDQSRVLGYCFDGLTSGINLQVILEEEANFMKASFQGTDVYQERQGKLEKYIPATDWEMYVESLFRRAEARAKMAAEQKQDDTKKEKRKVADVLIDYLRKNWGI